MPSNNSESGMQANMREECEDMEEEDYFYR